MMISATSRDSLPRREPWRSHLLCLSMSLALLGSLQAQTVLREWRGIPRTDHNDGFGHTLLVVGDVDGDGACDIAIGAGAQTVSGMQRAGACHLFSGSAGHLIRSVVGVAAIEYFGAGIAPAGDFDRDGRPDLLVGAADPSNVSVSIQHVVSTATGARLLQFRNRFGTGVGDVDQDGVPDFLLGQGDNMDVGRVDLFSGRTQAILASFLGQYPYQSFYGAFATGDLDGDGVPELGIGAWGSWPRGIGSGLWVYSGRTRTQLYRMPPPPTSDSFTRSVLSNVDVDGDGVGDILADHVGQRSFTGGGQILGFSGRTGSQIFVMGNTNCPPECLGGGLGAVGDLDGDGFDDFQYWNGRTCIQSGRDRSLLLCIAGAGVSSRLAPGDVNGDDFPDILIGGFYDTVTQQWLVRIYSGIPDGVQTYGSACADRRGVLPRIGATRSPRRNSRFALNLSRVETGLEAVLLLGTSNSTWAGGTLPFELTPFGFPGCFLRVSPDASICAVTSGPRGLGRATIAIDIPNDASLIGARFYAQWLIVDSQSPALNVTTTRGLAMQVLP